MAEVYQQESPPATEAPTDGGIEMATADETQITEVIEGGEIRELDPRIRVDPIRQQRAITTRTLAYSLVVLLGASILLHYITVLLLVSTGAEAALEIIDGIFTTWLPVVSGLAGSAVTYFFTRERRD